MAKRRARNQITSLTLDYNKLGINPVYLSVECATYRWKVLDEGYNFSSDRISIRGLLAKLWGSKVAGVLTLMISELPLGSPGTKSHLDVGPM